jgi:outer membrane protein
MLSTFILAASMAATSLSLDNAVAIALKQNLQYQSAHVAVAAARAQLRQSLAPRFPAVALQDTYQYVDRVAKLSTPFGALPFSSVNTTNVPLVALQYTIYDGGLTAAHIGEAEENLAAAQDQERQARGAVVAAVAKAYFDLVSAMAMRDVANRAVGVAAGHVKQARQLLQSGMIPRADLLRAQTELANEQMNQIGAASNVTLAQTALNDVLNVPFTTAYVPTEALDPPPQRFNLGNLLAAAHAQRGDLAAAQIAVLAAGRAVDAARSASAPQIKAMVADGNMQPAVVGGYHNQFSVSLNAVWTLFDNGYTAGRVAEAQAAVQQAQLGVQQLQNGIDLQVRQAYLNVNQAQARVDAAQHLVTLSGENLRLAQIRYRGGVGTALELQDAELRDRSALQELTGAQAALRQGVVQLRFAAGLY